MGDNPATMTEETRQFYICSHSEYLAELGDDDDDHQSSEKSTPPESVQGAEGIELPFLDASSESPIRYSRGTSLEASPDTSFHGEIFVEEFEHLFPKMMAHFGMPDEYKPATWFCQKKNVKLTD